MLYDCGVTRCSTSKFVLELLTIEIHSIETSLFRISAKVLSKEIDILTPFGQIQHFLRTFVPFKETGLSGTVVNLIFPRNYPSIRKHNCVERLQNMG